MILSSRQRHCSFQNRKAFLFTRSLFSSPSPSSSLCFFPLRAQCAGANSSLDVRKKSSLISLPSRNLTFRSYPSDDIANRNDLEDKIEGVLQENINNRVSKDALNLNTAAINVFSTSASNSLISKSIKHHVRSYCHLMEPCNIMFLLYLASKKKFVLSNHLLDLLVKRLYSFPAEEAAVDTPIHYVRKGFYGLRVFSCGGPSSNLPNQEFEASPSTKRLPEPVLIYVQYLTALLLSIPHRLDGETVGEVLYGIQNLGCQHSEVRQLLHVVYHKLSRHPKYCAFTTVEVSKCFYGLKRMHCDVLEVQRLLRVLSLEVEKLEEVMSPVEISNCFYGLNQMTSNTKETRLAVKSLTRFLASLQKPLNCRQLNNVMYGLQGMLSKEHEIRDCVEVLSTAIANTTEHTHVHAMSSQDAALICFGMKEMTSHYASVRRLVKEVSILIEKACNIPSETSLEEKRKPVIFRGGFQDVRVFGTCLLGLKNMSCEFEEVQNLLTVLHRKVQQQASGSVTESSQPDSARWISNGLLGMRNMTTSVPIVKEIVRFLVSRLEVFLSSSSRMSDMTAVLALWGLQAVCSESDDFQRRGVHLLANQLQSSQQQYKDKHTYNINVFREIVLAERCCRGMSGLHVEHEDTRVLLSWLYKQLTYVVNESIDVAALPINALRSMSVPLSKLRHNGVLVDELVDVWILLGRQFHHSTSSDELLTFTPTSHFGVCDLVSATRGMNAQPPSERAVGWNKFLELWCDSLQKSFQLSSQITAVKNRPQVPLNLILHAIGDFSPFVVYHMGKDPNLCRKLEILMDQLATQVHIAGPCYEYPVSNTPLRVESIVHALEGINNMPRNDWTRKILEAILLRAGEALARDSSGLDREGVNRANLVLLELKGLDEGESAVPIAQQIQIFEGILCDKSAGDSHLPKTSEECA